MDSSAKAMEMLAKSPSKTAQVCTVELTGGAEGNFMAVPVEDCREIIQAADLVETIDDDFVRAINCYSAAGNDIRAVGYSVKTIILVA